ncbi:hypothetical protein CCACVL1_14779 [Corchorus capsularis]|uniref:F-box domain-containing protein n=1 Tax=Corchorus capsularis TaxID=210143 RepID=A0A1R3I5J7_COCAP|nr:hypothetical protein CCACVL1_14779 [Corchorus capsularis]
MESTKPKKPDWSDHLPIDLLGLIANRLGLIDLLRFRVVCKNWNFVSSNASAEIEALPNNDPWFLIYDYDSKCMLKTDESKKIYRAVKIPEMNGATCIASNHGWLLLFKTPGSGSMCFFCPFSRARIEIPKFPLMVLNNMLREAQLMFLFTTGENSKNVFTSRASSLAQNVFNRKLSTQTGSDPDLSDF